MTADPVRCAAVMAWFPLPNAMPSLFPKPSSKLSANRYAYELRPMVKPTGFREYDARWIFEKGDQPDGR